MDGQNTFISHRYELFEEIGRGSMGVVYRGLDRLTGLPIALKRINLQKETLNFNSMHSYEDVDVAFAQEFQILATLRHPHIISVLDYGFDENAGPYFTMPFLENAQTLGVATQQLDIKGIVEILVQILQALTYLHRRQIIHRDLKPNNIIVTEGQVKVLDFGLAIQHKNLTDADEDKLIGTLAYLAPELLHGEQVSAVSDLYAIGVIAYELIVGHHPFPSLDGGNLTEFFKDVLYSAPDVTAIASVELQTVIGKLLEKDPVERYPNAQAVIQALCSAMEIPPPVETVTLRESFLQSAQFVGRTDEFRQLQDAVSSMQTEHQGIVYLIGGESGVGKSRLLDELQPYALARGILVLRGQAILEGGAPYQLWRDSLRYLALQADLNPMQTSILQTILPDLTDLIEQPIEPAPEVDPKTTQKRNLTVIETLFQQQTKPILLLLEDLQWAGENIAVLKHFCANIDHFPDLMIIGTYRDDEAPQLPEQFANITHIKLARLPVQAIEDLSVSILGDEIGRQPQIIDFLKRETEGNIFFIVEIIRTLAEEAGRLNQISQLTLPEKIFAGGIQTVLQRRLDQLPKSVFELLELTAISGRELDLHLLKHLFTEDQLTDWFNICANYSVLEVRDNDWRFSHDKLRETILDNLSEQTKQALHAKVATNIEIIYPDLTEHIVRLAYHWSLTDNVDQALKWTVKAGEQSLGNGVLQDAVQFFRRATEIQEKTNIPDTQKSRHYRLLARSLLGLGQINESVEAGESSLQALDYSIPANNISLVGGLVWQSLRQLELQLGLPKLKRQDEDKLTEALKSARILGETYIWSGLPLKIGYTYMLGLNLAELVGDSPIGIRNYMGASYVLSLSPFKRLAPFYQNKARQICQKISDPIVQADVLYGDGLLFLHEGQLNKSSKAFAEGKQLAQSAGDIQRWILIHAQHMNILYHLGDYEQAWADVKLLEKASRENFNLQYLVWSLGAQGAFVLLQYNDYLQALTYLNEARAVLEQAKDVLAKVYIHGLLALTYLRLEDYEQAEEHAERIYRGVTTKRTSGHAGLEGYPALVEVYMTLWQKTDEVNRKENYHHKVLQSLAALERYSRLIAIGKPRALLWRGNYEHQRGNVHRAQNYWKKSLSTAQTMAMAYDTQLAQKKLSEYA